MTDKKANPQERESATPVEDKGRHEILIKNDGDQLDEMAMSLYKSSVVSTLTEEDVQRIKAEVPPYLQLDGIFVMNKTANTMAESPGEKNSTHEDSSADNLPKTASKPEKYDSV